MREQLMKILTETCPGVDFEREINLIDDGILESLDIVTIVAEIIYTFGIELKVGDLTPDNFKSVDTMIELIQSMSE